MFSFLHAADIHLDSPLLNLDRYDGAPVEQFRNATRQAFDQLVELALQERVRFVLIAGDLFDGECSDSTTPLHFRRQVQRLHQAHIPVYLIQGNHDARVQNAFKFDLPESVYLFSTKQPETCRIEDVAVAIHGQGFSDRKITEDLSIHYPEPIPGYYNIGLLHTSCGTYEGHDTYAPSSIQGLASKGYDYWALGHIHKRQVLAKGKCDIVYAGTPQGRHIRESGPHGCELVTVDDNGLIRRQFKLLDVVRWETCTIDLSECTDTDELLGEVETEIEKGLDTAEGRPLAVRLILTGYSPLHTHLAAFPDHWDKKLREGVVNRFDQQVWVEKIKFATQSVEIDNYDLESDTQRDRLTDLLAGLQDPHTLELAFAEIREEMEPLLKLLPTDPRLAPEDRFDWHNPATREWLARDACALLQGLLIDSPEQGLGRTD